MSNDNDIFDEKKLEEKNRKEKRLAYGVLILLITFIYIFGGLLLGDHISSVEAIIFGAADLYALHLCGII